MTFPLTEAERGHMRNLMDGPKHAARGVSVVYMRLIPHGLVRGDAVPGRVAGRKRDVTVYSLTEAGRELCE
jgi:hypothetical protein